MFIFLSVKTFLTQLYNFLEQWLFQIAQHLVQCRENYATMHRCYLHP